MPQSSNIHYLHSLLGCLGGWTLPAEQGKRGDDLKGHPLPEKRLV
jgi:hypothetical protein